jgi:orotate phosphoribosyltransferase
MLEDVTTTGGSVIEAIKDLKGEGAVVNMVITVVDRDEGASAGLEEMNVELVPLVRAADLLNG